jgi:hypothetical protein
MNTIKTRLFEYLNDRFNDSADMLEWFRDNANIEGCLEYRFTIGKELKGVEQWDAKSFFNEFDQWLMHSLSKAERLDNE